jgi:NAD(P)-dependent dehydrogenase (short-subunit alcohol dehydrogenase family)
LASPLKVFITGASSGIGVALAAHYARGGAVLGLCARRLEPMQALAAGLGAPSACYRVDVTEPATVQAAAREFTERFGLPDLVIANAGVSIGTLTEDPGDIAAFRKVMDTNVLGVVATFQPFVAPMRERRSGTLAGIASVAGIRGLPGGGAYSASKAAAITYLESLRAELHGTGVAVVTLCPGYIRTPMTAVNRYRMPFILEADEGARRIARAIAGRRRLAVIPWQMALVAFFLRRLPGWLYDRLFARAPRKPRNLPQ